MGAGGEGHFKPEAKGLDEGRGRGEGEGGARDEPVIDRNMGEAAPWVGTEGGRADVGLVSAKYNTWATKPAVEKETVWRVLRNSDIELTCDPQSSTSGIHQKEWETQLYNR